VHDADNKDEQERVASLRVEVRPCCGLVTNMVDGGSDAND
jgi:hypothetical protein